MVEGKFIVFEGLDGAGTTTQAIKLTNYFFEKGKQYVPLLTREPTMLNDYGTEIRRRLTGDLLPSEEVVDAFEYWANLFVKDRFWHLDNVVVPNVVKGLQVISDRHMLSTLAYQSAQGGQMEKLIEMHQGMYPPCLTLFIQVPSEIALERIANNRTGDPEYFEAKKGFLERTAQNYLKAIDIVGDQQNVVIIDGIQSIDQVALCVQKEVNKLYGVSLL